VLEQARPLAPRRASRRRYLGPIVAIVVVAGLVLSILARLLGGGPAPAPEAAAATGVAQTDGARDGGVSAGSTAEAVPVAAGEASPPQGATAGAPAPPPPDPRVVAQQRMREGLFLPFRGLQGRFGIAVKDLGSGQTVLLNEHFPFEAASLYKLPVMYEVFKLREAEFLTFREELMIGPEDAAMDLGSLFWPIGTRITLGTALERMVTISDNSSAFMLTRRVGSWRINEDAVSLGMTQTRINGEDLSTSAYDMMRLLELIATGRAVDSQASAEMVHLLGRQQVLNRVPMLLSPEATIANKTGNWESAAHDVAIVYGPRATLVIAFLSDGVNDVEAVYDAMARAARNVYDLVHDPAFETRPDPPLPPATSGSYYVAPKLPAPAIVATSPANTAAPPSRAPAQPAPAVKPTSPPPSGGQPAPRQDPPATAPSTNQPPPTPKPTAAPFAPAKPTSPPPSGGQPAPRQDPTAPPSKPGPLFVPDGPRPLATMVPAKPGP
jgi:beta-lactamase class A